MCMNNNVVAVFFPNLDNIVMSFDGAATMLA